MTRDDSGYRWLGRHPVLVGIAALVISLVPSAVYLARTGGDTEGSVLGDLWPGLVIASLLLVGLVWATGWYHNVGLVRPRRGWWRWYVVPSVWAIGMLLVGRSTDWGDPDDLPVFALVLVLVLVGFVEEVVFRGFLLDIFRRRLSVPVAVIAVSGIFALTHLGTGDAAASLALTATAVFSLAVLQSALYLIGGSVVPVIAFHVLWDAAMFSGGSIDLDSDARFVAALGLIATIVMSLGYGTFVLQRFTHPQAAAGLHRAVR